MKPPAPRRGWRDAIGPIVRRLAPVTTVVERVATLAAQATGQPLTPLGALGLASAGLNGLRSFTERDGDRGYNIDLLTSAFYTTEAFRAGGATIRATTNGRGVLTMSLHGEEIQLHRDGSITLPAQPSGEFEAWMLEMFDRVLPSVLVVGPAHGDPMYTSTPGTLTSLRSTQGVAIAADTRPLLGPGGRCILIDGRPGVGKSTMAQEIACILGLGRTVIFEPGVLESTRPGYADRPAGTNLSTALRLTKPGAVIVDDIDKAHLALGTLEALRRAAKLVILTSNNGQHDDVLDAAQVRPGRIDEVFHVEAERSTRRAPFDRLTDAQWEEVREWPVASLNELEHRLTARGDRIRLDDLRDRLTRKTRSGDAMH